MARKGKPAKEPAPDADRHGTSTLTSLIVADLAMRASQRLIKHAVDRLTQNDEPEPADEGKRKRRRGHPLAGRLIVAAAVRVATRSVPGAILVSGGLLAKTLHDRRRRARAKAGDKSNKAT